MKDKGQNRFRKGNSRRRILEKEVRPPKRQSAYPMLWIVDRRMKNTRSNLKCPEIAGKPVCWGILTKKRVKRTRKNTHTHQRKCKVAWGQLSLNLHKQSNPQERNKREGLSEVGPSKPVTRFECRPKHARRRENGSSGCYKDLLSHDGCLLVLIF